MEFLKEALIWDCSSNWENSSFARRRLWVQIPPVPPIPLNELAKCRILMLTKKTAESRKTTINISLDSILICSYRVIFSLVERTYRGFLR